MIRKLFLIFVMFLLMLCGSANASVSISGNTIIVSNEPTITIPDVNVSLSTWMSTHPTYGVITDYMEEISPSVWLFKKGIQVSAGNLNCENVEILVNSSIVPISGAPVFGTSSITGSISFSNTTVRTWNTTTNSQETNTSKYQRIFAYNLQSSNDVRFYATQDILVIPAHNIILSNINISDSLRGIQFKDSSNVTIKNCNVTNVSGICVYLLNCSGVNISDFIYINDPSYRATQSTGSNAISIDYNCSNIILSNIYADSPRWGGVYFSSTTLPPHDISIENVTVLYSGHNGIDIHDGYNISVKNASIVSSISNNILITGPWAKVPDHPEYGVYNVSLYNIYSHNPSAAGISIAVNVSHISLENILLTHLTGARKDGIKIFDCDNITCVNVSSDGGASTAWRAVYSTYSPRDVFLYDSLISGSSAYDTYFYRCLNGAIINSKPTKLTVSNSKTSSGYYLDLIAKYANNTAVNNTEFTINCNNTSYSSTDVNRHQKTVFSTGATGRSVLPSESMDTSAVVYDYYAENGSNYYVSNNVSIEGVTLNNIIPDSRWYRSSRAISNYTITALINNSTDLHFTGYAPNPEYNNYRSGDSVKFQIWANEPLVNVVWAKDGVVMQNSTATTYETTISDAPITVDITGQSETGTVSKTFVIDPEQIITPGADPGVLAPIANFTANTTTGTYPAHIQFNDTSENSPTNWYWDFDNNGVVDSTSRNATCRFKAKGNYTVKLVVSNENNTDFETKSAYINVTGSTPTYIHYYNSFNNWLNSFYRYMTGA